MSELQICPKCGNPKGHEIKKVHYYADGKPVYDNRCMDCIKKSWMKIKFYIDGLTSEVTTGVFDE